MTTTNTILMEESWKKELQEEFKQPYMDNLRSFLRKEISKGKTIFPAPHNIFKAFDLTPFEQVKVVILGQDPYHGPNQAHGLSFSVPEGIKTPPSLVNIFKELRDDLKLSSIPESGNLECWAKQGVLLLNATLTVQAHQAGSHQKKGWEEFTDKIIHLLNEKKEGLVFVLWGSYAQKKGAFIDPKKHKIIRSVHPSPLSVYRGFFGHRPFSQINDYLQQQQQKPINWV